MTSDEPKESVNSSYYSESELRGSAVMVSFFEVPPLASKNRDSSVGKALGYRLDDRGSRVPFPVGAGNFSLRYRAQNGSGAHPASYPMDTRCSFPGGKAAGA
jgi:hypothetical protein